MCLEGMLTKAVSGLPGGKYISSFLSLIILVVALYFAIKSQQTKHFIFACCCPILYIIYHFAVGSKGKTEISTDTESSSY